MLQVIENRELLLTNEFESPTRVCDKPIHVPLWHRHYPHPFNINLSDFQFGSDLPSAKPQISIKKLNQIETFWNFSFFRSRST